MLPELSGMRQYCVYIMASSSKVIYIGVTNNLERRVYEHKNHLVKGFTHKYSITKLVYYEETNDVIAAISREKQIKAWLRKRKLDLVESMNPTWKDLAKDWYESSFNDCRNKWSIYFAFLKV